MKITNKLVFPLMGLALLVGVATSAVTITSAASTTTPGTGARTGFAARMGMGGQGQGNRAQMTPPAAMGKVTAVSGSSITIVDNRASTTYTVDASSATFLKDRGATASLADIAVGDMIGVHGTVSGTTITATTIHEGGFGGPRGRGGNCGMAPAGGTQAASAQ